MSFEQLEPRLALAVVISEFLASNDSGIRDFEGDRSDWIELQNTGPATVDVAGWYLTDEALNLAKWEIPTDPSTVLAPGDYLTIFADGKNGNYSGELHTDFSLSANGEYLGLVEDDGTTVAYDFGAAYPEQYADVSYGTGITDSSTATVTIVDDSSSASYLVPTGENAATDDHWREVDFNDSGWGTGTGGVGKDINSDAYNFITEGWIGTNISSEMSDTERTAYIRYEFDVANPEQLAALTLDLRMDDGFIVYLNDREVTRANFGEDFQNPQPAWNSDAGNMTTGSSAEANHVGVEIATPLEFDFTPYLQYLEDDGIADGNDNVLAFHGVNTASSDTTSLRDFLIQPVLTAERATGSSQVGYMVQPTAGRDNGVSTLGFVADTNFSVDRGFYSTTQSVAITTATSGAVIRYTTDGSAPTLTNGTTYTGPVSVATTTILRAAAFKTGYTPTNVDTQTYIFLDDVIDQDASYVTEPYATWGHDKDDGDSTDGYSLDDESDWEMDPDIVGGEQTTQEVNDALAAIPSMSLVADWDDLFGGDAMPGTPIGSGKVNPAPQGIYICGSSSERVASLEYFNPDSATDQFQVDTLVEIQGHSSTMRWRSDKLSFQVKFKNPLVDPSLNYPLFADTTDGENAVTRFDTLILDAGYNYWWHHANTSVQTDYARFVHDQVTADLQNLAGDGGAHGKFVHLYVNGLYWGMYYAHERPDDSYTSEYYGGSKDDYYVVKHANNDLNHEYTWVDGGVAAEEAYDDLLNAARAVGSNPTNATLYQNVADILDVDQFIDYMVVHYYVADANDWAHNNWYATFDAVAPDGKWRFHSWDQEHSFPTTDNGDSFNEYTDLTGKDDYECSTEIFRDLIQNSEFRLRFADRVQELMYNDGVLTPAVAQAVYEARTDEIDQAVIGESARWGDNRVYNDPYTRADFITIKNGVLNDFFPGRTSTVLGHFSSRGWEAPLDAPNFNQYGGEIPSGFDLVMTNPNGSGTIYYTLDGSDPREVGGAISASAIAYTGAIDLTEGAQVRARVRTSSTSWSAEVDKTFVLDEPFPLRIVELHYNPSTDIDGEHEFIELLNTSSSTISLDDVQITDFASTPYTFESGQSLAAGERIVVARNPVDFILEYGTGINLATGAGYADANLSNGGETISVLGPFGELVQRFTYGDQNDPGWPDLPDGDGPSLEYVGPLDADPADPNDVVGDPYDTASNWQASFATGGSPGTDGSVPNEDPVITSNGGGATASVNVAEGATAVATVTATDVDVPAQTLSFSITGGADSSLFDIVSATGVLTFISAPNYESPTDANSDGVYVVEVSVGDGYGGSDSQTISVTATDLNDAPVITSNGGGATASVNVAEGATAVTTVTATDEDVPADTLTFSIIGGADQTLFNIGSSSGALAFIAAKDYENPADANLDGVYEVTVQVSDGNGGTDSQAISVAVTNVNESPVITSNGGGATASANAQEDQTAVTTVTSTDVDGGTPVYSIAGGADQTLFSIGSSSGVLTFGVAPDFETPTDSDADGVYEVTVQVSDGNGGTDAQAISVTVTDMNDQPVITSNGGGATAAVDVPEETTAVTTVTAMDEDLPADTLTYSITGGADSGHFDIGSSSGALAFNTAPDYETPTDANMDNIYVVEVTVSDGNGGSDVQTLSVTVTGVNSDPVITSDGSGATAAVDVQENQTAVTTVTATDTDLPPQTLTYSITGGADLGHFNIGSSSGILAFDVAPDFETPTDANLDGIYVVEVTVDDGNGGSDSQAISVTVTNANDPPVITSNGGGATAAVNAQENQTAVTTVTSSDLDGGTPVYSIIGGADQTLFDVGSASGVLTFVAAPDFEAPTDSDTDGVYEVTVQVSDGNGGTDSQAISVTVTNVNESPAITSDGGGATAAVNAPENQTAVTTVTSSDVDGGTPVYSIVGGADAGLFNIGSSNGELVFSAAKDYENPTDANTDGIYEVTVQVADGNGGTDSQAISVTVTDANDAPVITSNGGGATASVNAQENQTAVTTVTSTDIDGGAPVYSIIGGADAGLFSIGSSSGALTFSSAPNLESPIDSNTDGVYEVTVQVADGNGGTDSQSISVTVTDVNDPPAITSDGSGATADVDMQEGTTAVTTVTAADEDVPADTLAYSITGGADAGHFNIGSSSGVLAFTTASFLATPTDANLDGIYVVEVTVDDGNGGTDVQTIDVTVVATGPGDPDALRIVELHYNPEGTGTPDQREFIELLNTGTTQISLDGVQIDFDNGEDLYTFQSGQTLDAGARIVVVRNVTEFTSFYGSGINVATGAGYDSIASLGNTIETITLYAPGAVVLQQFTYDDGNDGSLWPNEPDGFGPSLEYIGPLDAGENPTDGSPADPFDNPANWQASAVDNGSPGTGDANEAPVIASDGGGATAAVNVQENQTAVTTVTSTDVDGGTPIYSLIGGADQALFSIGSSTGVLTFSAAPDFEVPTDANTDGVYEVTVQVSDGNGGTDSQTIYVTVTDVAEAGLAGDYDSSGTVDDLDYDQWKSDFGTTVTPGTGSDGNSDGVVDAADYTVWRDNFGATLGAGAGSSGETMAAAAVVAPAESMPAPQAAAIVSVPVAAEVQDDMLDGVAVVEQESLLAIAEPVGQTAVGHQTRHALQHQFVAAGTNMAEARLRVHNLLLRRDRIRQCVDAAFGSSSPWLGRKDDAEDLASRNDETARDDVWQDLAWLQRLSHRRLG